MGMSEEEYQAQRDPEKFDDGAARIFDVQSRTWQITTDVGASADEIKTRYEANYVIPDGHEVEVTHLSAHEFAVQIVPIRSDRKGSNIKERFATAAEWKALKDKQAADNEAVE